MRFLKSLLILLLFACSSDIITAQKSITEQTVKEIPHPRILLLKGEEAQIKKSIANNPTWKRMHEAILTECDNIIPMPPVERIQVGRRLLDKSREALRRIFQLSYAYRMTGEEKYFNRCEKEMLAISNFSDWNPSHFLDVGEMTMAMAIGYDWLYPKLSSESKKTIREAIVSKGLNPSLDSKYNSWLKAVNNWNQVCNAGITFGALAVADDHPQLAKDLIERAVNSIHLPMGEYKPDGAYPEGYGYWGYGTSFNVMFLSAINTAFSSDFGLTQTPGFLQTARFLQNMTGVTGLCYNWGDSGLGGSLSPAMFWLAQHGNDPSLLWVEKSYLKKDDYKGFTRDRLLPAIMIWGKNLPLDKVTEPKVKFYKGQGANPICLMRTSWSDPNAIYLGFKVGSPSVNHGHMDIGSFVMEADGVRWASDFGMQDYESLESKGMSIFGRTQDAQRWTIFRLNNYSHGTLTVNNELQRVDGYAQIDKFSDKPDFMYAISDISSVYKTQLKAAKRGVAIADQKYVVVSDEIVAENKPTKVRWTMMTAAAPVLGDKTIALTKGDKKLIVKVNISTPITMKTWSTAPTNDYDAPNPGTTLVGFELELQPNQKQAFQVVLAPISVNVGNIDFNKPLEQW